MMVKRIFFALSLLKDAGVLDQAVGSIMRSALKSKPSLIIQTRYGISEEQLRLEVEKYGKKVLLLLFLPHAKFTIPSMLVYELLKAHYEMHRLEYLKFFRFKKG